MQRKFTVRMRFLHHLAKKMSDNETETSLMAIDTKNFGLTVSDFDSTLLPTHLNNYLNAMAGNPDAILLSMNFQKKMGVKLGIKVTYTTKDKKRNDRSCVWVL